MRKRHKPIQQELTYAKKLKIKRFKRVFEVTGEIIAARVICCAWRPDLIEKQVNVMQIDYDFYLAVDYQDEKRPWLRFGFLESSLDFNLKKYKNGNK